MNIETGSAAIEFAAVVPAYDCAATISGVVSSLRGLGLPVVVIDDGSTDRTAELAAAAGAIVLANQRNIGKGASLRRGLEWCADRGASHAVTMDADGQHLTSEVPVLLSAVRAHPQAIIVGQRVIDPAAVARNKLFGNQFANRWVEIACRAAIPDTQSGFRCYPVAATLALRCRARRFAFETEVLIRAVRAGMPVVSVPVSVFYPPPSERTSHYRPWLDTVRIILVVLGLIFRVY